MDPELYIKLIKRIKLKFRRSLNDNIDNPLCTLQGTNDEDQLLNCLRSYDIGSRLSKILNFNCTPAINEIYKKWNGKLRTRNLEKKLTNQYRNEIKNKIEHVNKSSNIINFSSKTRNPKGDYEETEGDDRIIKRAFKACNALKEDPTVLQTNSSLYPHKKLPD